MKLSYLDKLYSEFIRKRAIKRVQGCERCFNGKSSWKDLQTSHFYGRSRRSVRFDETNATGLCGACHMFLSSHPQEHYEWFRNYIGEAEFMFLEGRMRQIGKVDEKLLAIYYQEKIRELDDGT